MLQHMRSISAKYELFEEKASNIKPIDETASLEYNGKNNYYSPKYNVSPMFWRVIEGGWDDDHRARQREVGA